MIDLIIPVRTENCNLRKMLLSVLLQTVNDKISTLLIFSSEVLLEKYEEVINIFSSKIKISAVVCDDESASFKQVGYDMSDSEFVMFLNENDFFYDAFSVANALRKMDDSNIDIVCGKLVYTSNNKDFEEVNNIYMSVVSKLFRRSFLQENNIFFENDKVIECFFVGSAILLSENIAIEDFIIAVYDTSLHESFLSEVQLFVSDTIKIVGNIGNVVGVELTKSFISDILKILYNNYSLNIGYVDSLEFFKIMQPLELLYRKYI